MLTFTGIGLAKGGNRILADVSFEVPPGRIFAILGPSGAGKSTLLRLVCRLEDPDEGRILFEGEDVRDLDVLALRRRVGFVFQEPVLFGESVLENLRFAADPGGKEGKIADPGGWLARVGLAAEFLDRSPDSLSAGEKQRVALARALVPGPEVLLLDEPTSALDPVAVSGILRLVRDLRDDLGLTVVFVTHVVAHARQVADSALVLAAGRVLEAGGPDLFDAPAREETRAFLAGEEE